jgi:hypothetical protein
MFKKIHEARRYYLCDAFDQPNFWLCQLNCQNLFWGDLGTFILKIFC